MNAPHRAARNQVANRVQDDALRLTRVKQLMNAQQMHLHAILRGTPGFMKQQSLLHAVAQVDSDRGRIPKNLARGFFEADIEATLATTATGVRKMRSQRAFAAARGSRDQDGAATVIALPLHHVVDVRNARRDTLLGDLMVEREGSERKNG